MGYNKQGVLMFIVHFKKIIAILMLKLANFKIFLLNKS